MSDKILQSAELVSQLAKVAVEGRFDVKIVGSEMMKHGYALMSGIPLSVADKAVFAMLTLYEKQYIDVPQSGAAQ
jgi:hypothetical protein